MSSVSTELTLTTELSQQEKDKVEQELGKVYLDAHAASKQQIQLGETDEADFIRTFSIAVKKLLEINHTCKLSSPSDPINDYRQLQTELLATSLNSLEKALTNRRISGYNVVQIFMTVSREPKAKSIVKKKELAVQLIEWPMQACLQALQTNKDQIEFARDCLNKGKMEEARSIIAKIAGAVITATDRITGHGLAIEHDKISSIFYNLAKNVARIHSKKVKTKSDSSIQITEVRDVMSATEVTANLKMIENLVAGTGTLYKPTHDGKEAKEEAEVAEDIADNDSGPDEDAFEGDILDDEADAIAAVADVEAAAVEEVHNDEMAGNENTGTIVGAGAATASYTAHPSLAQLATKQKDKDVEIENSGQTVTDDLNPNNSKMGLS